LRSVGFEDPVIGALLAEWSEELPIPARSGSTVEPSEFVLPHGTFVVALCGGVPIGCGGVRRLTSVIGGGQASVCERYRATARGRSQAAGRARAPRGGAGFRGTTLRHHAEGPAALFRSAGYEPIVAYNSNPFARYWFAKQLGIHGPHGPQA